MAKKKKNNDKKGWFAALKPETRRGVAVVVFAALGLVSLLAFFDYAGRLGQWFNWLATVLFGQATILVPLIFFVIAGVIFRFLHERVHLSAMIGGLVLILSVVGLLHLFFPESQQGGYLGLAVAAPLLYSVGFWATFVVLLAALAIAILVTFNIPIRSITLEEPDEDVPVAENERAAQEETTGVFRRLFGWFRRSADDAASFTTRTVPDSDTEIKDEEGEDEEENLLVGDDEAGDTDEEVTRRARRPSTDYTAPSLDLLESGGGKPSTGDIKSNATIIRRTLQNFGIEVEMGEVNVGPTVTQYTLRPATGVKLSKIESLQKDLSLALAAHPIRIEAPIPGRSLVGIEVPNTAAATVRLGSLLQSDSFKQAKRKFRMPLAMGRDVAGSPVWSDLATMPHLLIAGATGSGKSVGINSILLTLLYQFSPEELRLILVDPKRVELPLYDGIPHLLSPVIVNTDKVINALRWAISEMEERYEMLADVGARDIESYNDQIDRRSRDPLPYLVIVIDELADIMSNYGREVEGAIVRLAQMARAVGIHLIVSTQRPSVEVITGLIKANITARVAFQVPSQVDSRTILDQAGAEKLLGNGDMLFLSSESAHPRRIQGAFVAEQEVKKVVSAIRIAEEEREYDAEVTEYSESGGTGIEDLEDDRYEEARELVIEVGKASASFLQRRMQVGYARAARLIDMLEQDGIVGPQKGSKPRDVLVEDASEGEDIYDE